MRAVPRGSAFVARARLATQARLRTIASGATHRPEPTPQRSPGLTRAAELGEMET